VAFPN